MKWERSDFRVGAAVLAVMTLVVASVLWLSPGLGSSGALYADFTRVDGLAVQAPVHLNGYAVGRVDRIEPRSAERGGLVFRVRMTLDWRLPSGDSLPLAVGTTARLTPPAVQLGGGFSLGTIDLMPPPEGGAPLRPGATIPGVRTPAMVDVWQTIATDLSADMSRTFAAIRALTDTLTLTARSVSRASDSTTAMTISIDRAMNRDVPALMASLQRDLATADTLMRELRRVSPAALAGMDSARVLLGDSRRLVADLGRILGDREPQLDRVLANLDTTSALLQHFVRQVSQKPTRVLTGVKPPVGVQPTPTPERRDSLRR